MRRDTRTTALWVACSLAGCGSGARVADPGPGGSSVLDGGSFDAASPALAPDASPPPAGCSIAISGAYAAMSGDAGARADLERTSAGIACDLRQGDANVGFWVSLPGAGSPGPYAGTSAVVEVSQPGGGAVFQGSCAVDLLTFSPATKGGMSARFACPTLSGDGDLTGTSFFGEVAVTGAIELPPALDPVPDAGARADVDAGSTCTMSVHGAYQGAGAGEGDDSGCLVTVGETSFYVAPFGAAGSADSERMEISGNSWCPSCLARYYASAPCAFDVQLDEGIGGRFVATYDCEGLRAGDGTVVGASGTIDGVHRPPPQ